MIREVDDTDEKDGDISRDLTSIGFESVPGGLRRPKPAVTSDAKFITEEIKLRQRLCMCLGRPYTTRGVKLWSHRIAPRTSRRDVNKISTWYRLKSFNGLLWPVS